MGSKGVGLGAAVGQRNHRNPRHPVKLACLMTRVGAPPGDTSSVGSVIADLSFRADEITAATDFLFSGY